jgi:hypothetical protein
LRAEQGAARAALRPWLGVAALTLTGALVYWIFDALPFQDLPAHAGLIALRHRFASSAFDQQFFVFSPHLGPYSLFRWLGERFVAPLGPVGAVRAIATLPLVLTPLALVWARTRLHGDSGTTAAYFGLALGFGFMTLLGFASYLMGVTVLIVGVTMWLELMALVDTVDAQAPRAERAERVGVGHALPASASALARAEWRIAAFAPFIFLAHGHAFLLFLAIAGLSALAGGRRLARAVRTRALVPALALAAWVAWAERAASWPTGSAPLTQPAFDPHFQSAWDKISLLITPTLITRTGVDAAVGVLVWLVLAAATFATARSLRAAGESAGPPSRGRLDRDQLSKDHARALLVAIGGLTAAFLVLPHSIGWFGFVDGRLVPVILFLAVMSIRRSALEGAFTTVFDFAARAAAVVMVATALIASYAFQAEAAGYREVLASVPARARLLNLPLEPNSRVFTAHPFIHYDKLIVADRPAVVSDVWFHQGTALYPTPRNPALSLPASYSESNLRSIDWPAYRLADWDYVLIRLRPTSREPVVPGELTLEAHRGGWWLFRNIARGARERAAATDPR